MFKRRKKNANPFHGGSRSERAIVYGDQVWAFVVLVLVLAVFTSPVWLIRPPSFYGSRDEVRMAGAAFWFALGLLALLAGRSWGLRITLNPAERTVSRNHCSPWRVRTVWSFSGDQISYVSLSVNREGIARLEAWLKNGSVLLVEKGVNEAELRTLGTDLAGCWGVPFRS